MQSGPGFMPTFLYYFVSTTFIAVFIFSKGLEGPNQLEAFGNPFQIAVPLGLLAGGMGAYFNGYKQLEMPLNNRGADLKKLNQVLKDMGYAETQEFEEAKVYDRSFPSSLFAGKLIVQLNETTVNISGRASRIRGLKKLLEIE